MDQMKAESVKSDFRPWYNKMALSTSCCEAQHFHVSCVCAQELHLNTPQGLGLGNTAHGQLACTTVQSEWQHVSAHEKTAVRVTQIFFTPLSMK